MQEASRGGRDTKPAGLRDPITAGGLPAEDLPWRKEWAEYAWRLGPHGSEVARQCMRCRKFASRGNPWGDNFQGNSRGG